MKGTLICFVFFFAVFAYAQTAGTENTEQNTAKVQESETKNIHQRTSSRTSTDSKESKFSRVHNRESRAQERARRNEKNSSKEVSKGNTLNFKVTPTGSQEQPDKDHIEGSQIREEENSEQVPVIQSIQDLKNDEASQSLKDAILEGNTESDKLLPIEISSTEGIETEVSPTSEGNIGEISESELKSEENYASTEDYDKEKTTQNFKSQESQEIEEAVIEKKQDQSNEFKIEENNEVSHDQISENLAQSQTEQLPSVEADKLKNAENDEKSFKNDESINTENSEKQESSKIGSSDKESNLEHLQEDEKINNFKILEENSDFTQSSGEIVEEKKISDDSLNNSENLDLGFHENNNPAEVSLKEPSTINLDTEEETNSIITIHEKQETETIQPPTIENLGNQIKEVPVNDEIENQSNEHQSKPSEILETLKNDQILRSSDTENLESAKLAQEEPLQTEQLEIKVEALETKEIEGKSNENEVRDEEGNMHEESIERENFENNDFVSGESQGVNQGSKENEETNNDEKNETQSRIQAEESSDPTRNFDEIEPFDNHSSCSHSHQGVDSFKTSQEIQPDSIEPLPIEEKVIPETLEQTKTDNQELNQNEPTDFKSKHHDFQINQPSSVPNNQDFQDRNERIEENDKFFQNFLKFHSKLETVLSDLKVQYLQNKYLRAGLTVLVFLVVVWILTPGPDLCTFKVIEKNDESYFNELQDSIQKVFTLTKKKLEEKASDLKNQTNDDQALSRIFNSLKNIQELETGFQVQVIESHSGIWKALEERNAPSSPPRKISLSIPLD